MAERVGDDESGADFVPATYSTEQLADIMKTVGWRPDSSLDEIGGRIQRAARWYAPYRELIADRSRPSKRERALRAVKGKLDAAAQSIRTLPRACQDDLQIAGERLAREEGALPDIEPDYIPLPPVPGKVEQEFVAYWDSAQQIEVCLDRLHWLVRCVELAADRAKHEKATHGSPVPDDALHTVIRLLHVTYFCFAADPRTPSADTGDESAEQRTWRGGELLDFLQAALRPLGIQKYREAIYSDWRRAVAALPKYGQMSADKKVTLSGKQRNGV